MGAFEFGVIIGMIVGFIIALLAFVALQFMGDSLRALYRRLKLKLNKPLQ